MTRRIGIAVAAFLLAAVSPAGAMRSGPEPTLWSQVEFSEIIVVADVASVEAFEPVGERGATHRAVLKVVETWKGSDQDAIEIEYPGYVICPSPGHFLPGRRMVAFLSRWQGKLIAGGDNATRYAEGQDLEDLRVMVRSALAIQTTGKGSELHENKRRWMVEAAVRPGTRADGLDGLSPHSFFGGPSFKLKVESSEFPDLDDTELQRLARLYITLKPAYERGSMLSLLKILEGYDDPLVDAATVALYEQQKASSRSDGWLQQLDTLTCARRGTCPGASGGP